MPEKWDNEADVVIVGSGFAGLSAALEARLAGATVLVVEKMGIAGGNSVICGGAMAVAKSPLQKQKGVEDSAELMVDDMVKAGHGLNYPELAKMVAERSAEAFLWCRDYLGAEFKDELAHFGGHCVQRTHTTANHTGAGIIRPMFKKAEELDITILKKTCVDRIITNGVERVAGIEVTINDERQFIRARRGLIVASGGFSADVSYRLTQDPRLTEKISSTNHPGATAECLKEMLRIGANPVQLSWIQLGPWTSPEERGFGWTPVFAAYSSFTHGIIVNPVTGERFVDELADRKIHVDAIIKTGNPAVSICDEDGAKPSAHVLEKLLRRGVVHKFDTLDALAVHYEMPVDKLKAQVTRYNEYVSKGSDPEFNKPFKMKQGPIATAPYYAVRLWPKVHHTMGGVQIDTSARVIDIRNGEPIPGLYACGEVTGGIHGACRLGSVAISECIVFGRIAGQQAAKT